MDDVINERFRRIEERLTAVEQAVTGMESRLTATIQTGLTNVARGFEVALDAAGASIRAHIDGRFGETMRRFQEVTDERQRMAVLEARMNQLEALLRAGGKGQ